MSVLRNALLFSLLIGITACSITPPDNALSAAQLRSEPVYGTNVTVYGKVRDLGTLDCKCFYIDSDGDYLNVWYDMMVSGTNMRPAVDVSGINNRDWIIVTGELRSDDLQKRTFWAASITRLD